MPNFIAQTARCFTFVQTRWTCIYSHSIETVVIVTIVLQTEQPQPEAALIILKSVIGDRVKLWGDTRLVTEIDRLNQFTGRLYAMRICEKLWRNFSFIYFIFILYLIFCNARLSPSCKPVQSSICTYDHHAIESDESAFYFNSILFLRSISRAVSHFVIFM